MVDRACASAGALSGWMAVVANVLILGEVPSDYIDCSVSPQACYYSSFLPSHVRRKGEVSDADEPLCCRRRLPLSSLSTCFPLANWYVSEQHRYDPAITTLGCWSSCRAWRFYHLMTFARPSCRFLGFLLVFFFQHVRSPRFQQLVTLTALVSVAKLRSLSCLFHEFVFVFFHSAICLLGTSRRASASFRVSR